MRRAACLLAAERTALNFFGSSCRGSRPQRPEFVKPDRAYQGPRAACCTPQRTTPGLARHCKNNAVAPGGGGFKTIRFGLDDAILIKDNQHRHRGAGSPRCFNAAAEGGSRGTW